MPLPPEPPLFLCWAQMLQVAPFTRSYFKYDGFTSSKMCRKDVSTVWNLLLRAWGGDTAPSPGPDEEVARRQWRISAHCTPYGSVCLWR